MDHSNVKEYFEKYLKTYSPYKDSQMYQALMDYLLDNFSKNLYQDIPKILKELYEENRIDISIYDYLLKGVGVPQHVIDLLPVSDKVLFFNNLTDFYRYRGDIDFFKRVSALFPRSVFDIYELYIDYDETVSGEMGWVFKPYLMVKNSDSTKEVPSINYRTIYNDVPSLLINENQLDRYLEQNNVILPIKSNIVLLDASFAYEVGGVMNLITTTFVKQYGSVPIDIYFDDELFTFTVRQFYIIWHYILLKNYNTSTIGGFALQWIIEYSNYVNPYNLDDIEELLLKYNSIDNVKEVEEFYENYISPIFKTYTRSIETNWEMLTPLIRNDFVTYLNQRIENSIDYDSLVYNQVLNEMLDSFMLYVVKSSDDQFIKYSDYFINSLTRISLDPKKTNPYILLNNFKPFHTELFTQHDDYILSRNKFDITTPHIEYDFLLSLQSSDFKDLIDYNYSNFLFKNYTTNEKIDHVISKMSYVVSESFDKNELMKISQRFDYYEFIDFLDYINYNISINNAYNLIELIDLYINKYTVVSNDVNNSGDNILCYDMNLNLLNLLNTIDFQNSNLIYMSYNNLLKDTNYDLYFDKVNYDAYDYVVGDFAFSTTSPWIRVSNILNFISIGFGGLSVGDKIYNANDDSSYAVQIVNYDYDNNRFILDDVYYGKTKRGNLRKINTFKEKQDINFEYFSSDVNINEQFEIIKE